VVTDNNIKTFETMTTVKSPSPDLCLKWVCTRIRRDRTHIHARPSMDVVEGSQDEFRGRSSDVPWIARGSVFLARYGCDTDKRSSAMAIGILIDRLVFANVYILLDAQGCNVAMRGGTV